MSNYQIFYVYSYDAKNNATSLVPAQFATDPGSNNIVDPNIQLFNSAISPSNGYAVNPNDVFVNENGRTTANYLTQAYQMYDANGQPLAQQNPNAYYVAPLDYNVFDTIDTVKAMTQPLGQGLGLSPFGALITYNAPNIGAGDLQHDYDDGQYGSNFVKALRISEASTME